MNKWQYLKLYPLSKICLTKRYLNIQLKVYETKKLIKITNEVSKSPSRTAVDQLIAQFSVMTDVSFIYVKHYMISGFVTYKKNKNSTINSFLSSDEYTSVYTADIDLWRKKL